jgi:hypothetical protein
MPTSNWARLIIALATLVSASIVFATGGHVDLNLARAVVTASTVVILFLLVFDRWLWHWPGIRRLARRPVLHGTWKAELKTSFTTRKDEVIEAYLVIRQTYSTIYVDMLFDRSQSTCMSGDLVLENGRCILYYVFRSDKQTLERDENPPARGAAQLTVAAKPSPHLEGDYWMEHGTHGHVATIGHSPVTYDTYSAAQRGAYR